MFGFFKKKEKEPKEMPSLAKEEKALSPEATERFNQR